MSELQYQSLEGKLIGGKPAREVVARRNARILKLFSHYDLPVRLIGEVEKPAVIYNDQWCLSCWAKNFDLVLNDAPWNGNAVATIKLTDLVDESSDILPNYVNNEQFHRRVYRVMLGGSGLYLAGYNFRNREDGSGRYPVFAKVHPKIYFTADKAQELCEELAKENYNAVVV